MFLFIDCAGIEFITEIKRRILPSTESTKINIKYLSSNTTRIEESMLIGFPTITSTNLFAGLAVWLIPLVRVV